MLMNTLPMRNSWRVVTAAVIAFFCIWEIYVWVAQLPTYILPPPSAVFRALVLYHRLILYSTLTTLTEMLLGLTLGVLLGLLLAVPLVYSTVLRGVGFPLLIALEGTPKLALAPIIVIWFGAGLEAKVALATLLAFFPVAVHLSRGLRAVDEEVELFVRSLCAPEWKVFWKVRLPAAVPFLFDALRLAIPSAMVGAVIGEFISSRAGLGYILLTAVGGLNMTLAFASLLVMATISASGYLILLPLEHRRLLWRPLSQR
jgi:NitT/TauT family transport system permease protein